MTLRFELLGNFSKEGYGEVKEIGIEGKVLVWSESPVKQLTGLLILEEIISLKLRRLGRHYTWTLNKSIFMCCHLQSVITLNQINPFSNNYFV